MNRLRDHISTLRTRLSLTLEEHLSYLHLPVPPRSDDLFLVEFPKSGITWLTFLIANINILISGDRRTATFFNINDFVPDIHSMRQIAPPPLPTPGYRCIKSHAPFTKLYRKVVYLVRDPRHVMVSYWRFLEGLGRGMSMDLLVRDPKMGIAGWDAHVRGWLDNVDASTSFTTIRYEDLIADPAGEMRRLYQLLGWAVDDEILATAIERSSIDAMSRLEAQFNERHPACQNLEFVRKGGAGGPRAPISDELRRYIEDRAGATMRRLGYAV